MGRATKKRGRLVSEPTGHASASKAVCRSFNVRSPGQATAALHLMLYL